MTPILRCSTLSFWLYIYTLLYCKTIVPFKTWTCFNSAYLLVWYAAHYTTTQNFMTPTSDETLLLFTQMLLPNLTDPFKTRAVAVLTPVVTLCRHVMWFPSHFDSPLFSKTPHTICCSVWAWMGKWIFNSKNTQTHSCACKLLPQ